MLFIFVLRIRVVGYNHKLWVIIIHLTNCIFDCSRHLLYQYHSNRNILSKRGVLPAFFFLKYNTMGRFLQRKRCFLITIKITLKCWHYKDGDMVKCVCLSNGKQMALNKFNNTHRGSEYPSYEIHSIEEVSEFIFYPIL
jgi:hypothetical protein